MDDISSILSAQGLRTTQPRVSIFRILSEALEPLAISDITHRAPDIDRVSIYRTLELFARLNIVTVVHVGWKKRYELASAYQKHHHHHLVCNTCGLISMINSDQLEHIIQTVSSAHQFTPSGHTFEITGECSGCREET